MVRRHYVSGEVGNVSVQIDDVNLMMLLKLAKSGYGSINELLQTRSDLVVKAYQFEVFCGEYESEMLERMKQEK